MEAGLRAYLDELRQQGNLDSEGAFTMDQGRALEKLRRYQLAEPELYVLALVASAVACGAQRVHVHCGARDFELRHDGRPYEFEELATLFSSLVVGGDDRQRAPARELATALNALSRLKPGNVRVLSSGADGLVQLHMNARQLVVRKEPSGGFESYVAVPNQTSIHIQGLRRSLVGQVQALAAGAWPETRALRLRCHYAPVEIFLKEELINPTYSLGLPLAVNYTAGVGRLPLTWQRLTLQEITQPPGDFEGLVALLPGRASEITALVNGVAFPLPAEISTQGVWALVDCAELRKDLSQTQLVQDEVYERVTGWISDTVQILAKKLAGAPHTVMAADRLRAADLLETLALNYIKTWQAPVARYLFPGIRELRVACREREQILGWIMNYEKHGLADEADHYRRRAW